MKNALFLLSFLLIQVGLKAVNPPADLNGEELKTWLKENFYDNKHITLGYDGSDGARSMMYNYIDNKDNVITGVYSGYEVSWTYGGTGTNPAPINCEHTVPQSFFGKEEPMKSDIHHLFPTYGNWNSTRSNYPFAEIDDEETTKWMYLSTSTSTVPSSNLNAYSEYANAHFEPREAHKGDCARAIFYFFTMYPTQAGDISSVADINTLYQWHLNDPVDTYEMERNNGIEIYQGDRNPYIDYPELVARAFGLSDPATSAPATPSLQSTSTQTNIELSWTNVYNENGYNLYKSEDGSSFTNVASLSANEASYTDNTVSSGITYYYYVVAYNTNGNSDISNQVNSSLQSDSDNEEEGSNSTGEGIGEATELFISEYIEGSSYNKAIEIANFTNTSVDLSAYSLKTAFNGATSWGTALSLSGTLAAGDVYIITHASASMASEADVTNSTVINFNGDDAIGLFKNNVLIDAVNTLGNPKGNNVVKDLTLVRKPTINEPNTTFDLDEWNSYQQDKFTYLGFHEIDGTTDINNYITSNSVCSLYPNPAKLHTKIKIEQDELIGFIEISVYNLNGNKVYKESKQVSDYSFETTLDVSHLQNGVYMVKINTSGTELVQKLVIK